MEHLASRLHSTSRRASGCPWRNLPTWRRSRGVWRHRFDSRSRRRETVFTGVSEAIEIGRRAGTQVDILHLKIADQKLWNQIPELIGHPECAQRRTRHSGEHLPLHCRAERRAAQHHSTMGARGRQRGDAEAAEGSVGEGPVVKRHHRRHSWLVQPLHRCWQRLQQNTDRRRGKSRIREVCRQALERADRRKNKPWLDVLI
jgi:hypothetical protein